MFFKWGFQELQQGRDAGEVLGLRGLDGLLPEMVAQHVAWIRAACDLAAAARTGPARDQRTMPGVEAVTVDEEVAYRLDARTRQVVGEPAPEDRVVDLL